MFLLIQQGERLFLLGNVVLRDPPSAGLLAKTLVIGLLADAVTTFWALALAFVLAVLFSLPFALFKRNGKGRFAFRYDRGLVFAFILMALSLFVVSTADIGYYRYNHQHLDFVFFEYVDELLHSVQEEAPSQAGQQTTAELDDARQWMFYVGGFVVLEMLLILIWSGGFWRCHARRVPQWEGRSPYITTLVLAIMLGGSAYGIGPLGPSFAHVLQIESEPYRSLSQNPILFARQPVRDVFLSQWGWTPAMLPVAMDLNQAVQITQAYMGGTSFPVDQYPLVKEHHRYNGVAFNRPANIVLIFVEGLDRRYVGQEIHVSHAEPDRPDLSPTVRLTPFLDRFKEDSVYFEHFFSNGVQTTRGLYATLCSAFPRQGTAVIKTRNGQDYLCLPSLLRQAGFQTEMVVSLDSDLPGLRPFLERNGMERFYSERDFPPNARRLGVGLTDGALFDFLRGRIESLQAGKAPFFLATMTSGTHHPFTVPLQHADVRALREERDPYLAALRYFDLEFERFFTGLQQQGLLNNTMILVLGDHGRHEPIGSTDIERQAGHFLAPLFIWLDPSLRRDDIYRPHTVDRIASQVDVAPTILAMNGLTPRLAPFMGQDLSCLLITQCLYDNRAYVSSVYDDLIGIADPSGLWLFSFRDQMISRADLGLHHRDHISLDESQAALHYHEMVALYLTTNLLIEHNQMWSWTKLGSNL
ncbi:LTA synthase family protein [Nitrospira sp. Nam74]